MNRKHCEIIKAWADDADIQYKFLPESPWTDINNPAFLDHMEYRIKPEPKPDIVAYCQVSKYKDQPVGMYVSNAYFNPDNASFNLKLIIDGETGKLKDAEVLK